MIKTAFVLGFEKTAIIGLAADAVLGGLPSIIGLPVGHGAVSPDASSEDLERTATGKDVSWGRSLLNYGLIPGYTGYRFAQKNQAEKALTARTMRMIEHMQNNNK